jgi:transcriptional antiterminator NusG
MSDTDITPDDTTDETANDAEVVESAPDDGSSAAVESPDAGDAPESATPDEPLVDEPVAEAPAAPEPTDEAAPDVAAVAVLDEEDLLEAEEPEVPKVESPYDRPGRWYVVHTQSGHEKKAQQNLAARTESMNMEERIYETVIPMEDVVEFRNGKKVVVQKKMFPGYLLVRANLNDDAWYVVRNTPSVVNFVGSGGKPSPLTRREVENFLGFKEEGTEATPTARSKARLEYEMGETVRVKEGPFADFSGEIVEINEDQLKVKVLVNIFGRETPVELEFSQVARL